MVVEGVADEAVVEAAATEEAVDMEGRMMEAGELAAAAVETDGRSLSSLMPMLLSRSSCSPSRLNRRYLAPPAALCAVRTTQRSLAFLP